MYNTHISPYTTKPVEQAEVREGQVLSKIKYSTVCIIFISLHFVLLKGLTMEIMHMHNKNK